MQGLKVNKRIFSLSRHLIKVILIMIIIIVIIMIIKMIIII